MSSIRHKDREENIKYFTPKKADNTELLFDGGDDMFKQLARKAKVNFAYGCGLSTIGSSFNIKGKIYLVDTSGDWVNDTKNKSCSDNIPHLEWVDCGPIGG